MNNGIKLRTRIDVSSDDIEKIWVAYAQEESAALKAHEHLRGPAAQRAAEELNHTLDVDVFDVLAQGWAAVPAVRNAVQLSALMEGPPAILRLDQHTVTSTSHPVLSIQVAQDALPELRLTLQMIAGMQSATLAARAGRIELIALGKASVIARLMYKSMLIKEHATSIEGAARDPFRHQRTVTQEHAGVDFHI